MKRLFVLFLCVAMLMQLCVLPANAEKKTFDDVPEDSWYYNAVSTLSGYAIIGGTGANKFSPNKYLTREEAVAMVLKMLGGSITIDEVSFEPTGKVFDDVSAGKWFTKDIEFACKSGMIAGIGDRKFGVGQPIKRQDLAVIIFKLCLDNLKINSDNEKVRAYNDYDQISGYALEAMTAMCGMKDGYVGETYIPNLYPMFYGYNNYLNPQKYITRAEAACALYSVKCVDQLPLKTVNDLEALTK